MFLKYVIRLFAAQKTFLNLSMLGKKRFAAYYLYNIYLFVQHLFEIEIFCSIKSVLILNSDQFLASLWDKSINFSLNDTKHVNSSVVCML